ncbi:MAG TPA: hypothetical protein VGL22_16180 [Terracidiphilus sp.]|jgi:hypothetical protein
MVWTGWKSLVFPLVTLALPAFLTRPALAQTEISPATGPTGLQACGDPKTKFDVKYTDGHVAIQPVDGMAVVVVIEDDSKFASYPKPVTRVGLDGEWIGATRGNSFTSFVISPGEHHLCASWQPQAALGLPGATVYKKMSRRSSVQSLHAQPGGVYYFQIKNVYFLTDISYMLEIHMDAVDKDEGELLASDRKGSQATKK